MAVDYFQFHYPGSTIMFDMSTVYIASACVAVVINNLLLDLFTYNTRITFGKQISTIYTIHAFNMNHCHISFSWLYSSVMTLMPILCSIAFVKLINSLRIRHPLSFVREAKIVFIIVIYFYDTKWGMKKSQLQCSSELSHKKTQKNFFSMCFAT